jgi:hypothetical protein
LVAVVADMPSWHALQYDRMSWWSWPSSPGPRRASPTAQQSIRITSLSVADSSYCNDLTTYLETCRKIVFTVELFSSVTWRLGVITVIIDSWDPLRLELNRSKFEGRSKFFTPTGAPRPGLTPETNSASMIISFTSPPTLYPVSRSRVDVSEDEDFYVDNNHDLEAENATITTPGEFITSARAFMR